jgi:hypothetical protein
MMARDVVSHSYKTTHNNNDDDNNNNNKKLICKKINGTAFLLSRNKGAFRSPQNFISGYQTPHSLIEHRQIFVNPLKTKRILSNIKTQGVPRSKHSPPQFKKPII